MLCRTCPYPCQAGEDRVRALLRGATRRSKLSPRPGAVSLTVRRLPQRRAFANQPCQMLDQIPLRSVNDLE
jgi:hypothetical protein